VNGIRVTTLIDVYSALVKVTYQPNNGYSYVTIVAPSEMTEQGFQPAESCAIALSMEMREKFISALNGENSDVPRS
jgi:hypothetical protein